ncbi:MAG TPA: CocE/NonD family hydrolase [Mycobacteriales bacterium]|jgi:putative CocE/NonD family hydrolase|nr:CocE/NonD family hydrolase [Mycobacteriales bacterium]
MSRRFGLLATLALVASTLLAHPTLSQASTTPHASPAAEAFGPHYSKTYSVQQFIRMKDGVDLGATITFPSRTGSAPAPGRFPVVLDLTPYGRDGECGCDSAAYLASYGFVFAVVDVRGTGGSGGNLNANYFSPRQARDGYEVVQYLGTRRWSNGKVGMSGGSYLGIMQYLVAEQQPSHLAAIAPNESLADLYSDAAYPGGILSLFFDTQYLAVQGAPGLATPNTSPQMLPGTIGGKLSQATGRSVALDYLSHNTDDHFYRARSPITHASRIKVPVYVLDGWHDAFEAGNLRMFEALQDRKAPTFVHIGNCTHKGCGGVFDPLGSPDPDDLALMQVRFFQRYLMGLPVPKPAPVRVYVQKLNRYVDGAAWPLPSTRFTSWHLNDGYLSTRPAARSTEHYLANPTAGLSMSLDQQGTVAITPYVPLDQRLEDNQGLTWRTPVLAKAMTINGPAAMHLVAASSATDTDWFVKISDVEPGGTERIVAEGQLRASMRKPAHVSTRHEPVQSLRKPHPITPGRFVRYQIAIAPTAYRFAAGHRLQIRLTSYNLPNALPATFHIDVDDPGATVINPLLPATNTVRIGRGGTTLTLPISSR